MVQLESMEVERSQSSKPASSSGSMGSLNVMIGDGIASKAFESIETCAMKIAV